MRFARLSRCETLGLPVRAKDVDRLMGYLTDDVVMMHPNRPAVAGKEANRADP